MAEMPTTRLSSDLLFHYTNLDAICPILQGGFRHGLSKKESLPHPLRQWQMNFNCCFCDLLPEQAGEHQRRYGDHALALTKDWGIANEISPVRYIHERSPGMKSSYLSLENLFRSSRDIPNNAEVAVQDLTPEEKQAKQNVRRMHGYLLLSLLYDEKLVQSGDFEAALRENPELKEELLGA
jgi:hypothetical protein